MMFAAYKGKGNAIVLARNVGDVRLRLCALGDSPDRTKIEDVVRILLVDDEPHAAQVLAKGLREEADAVDIARDGRNDFLGVGVDSFGVTPGSHLGTIDPTDFSWVQILGSQVRNRSTILSRLQPFERTRERSRAGEEQERILDRYQKSPTVKASGLPNLTALTRSGRKRAAVEGRRMAVGRLHAGV